MTQPASPCLVLASASPRRSELLERVGLRLRLCPVDLDESPLDAEAPAAYVARMARLKAEAAARLCAPTETVLAADTTVVVDGELLHKPADRADAEAMLRRLSGRAHSVLSGVHVLRVDDRFARACVVETRVHFAPLDSLSIARYIDSGEPFDKAGGYGIQGLAAVFVAAIEGSYSNVVGLPLCESLQLLRELGVADALLLATR